MRKLTGLAGAIILAALLASCISNKKVVYLQTDLREHSYHNPAFVNQYRIRPNDLLQVRVNSIYPEANELIMKLMQTQGNTRNIGNASEGFFYINGYSVDDSGQIKLPLIGMVDAVDKTTRDLERTIEKAFLEYYDGISVIVKVSGINVSLLGQFNAPGDYVFYENNVSLLEAISRARDMTDFADRRNLRIYRTVGEQINMYTIDITDVAVLENEHYYLQRGDVIYAPPLKSQQFGFKRDGLVYTLSILSVVSSTLLIYSLIQNF